MISSILIRLGIIKITPQELYQMVEELYAKTIEHTQGKRQLSPDKLHKSKFEIALFIHCATMPIFERILADDIGDGLRHLVQNDIMLRGLENVDKTIIKTIMNERFELHNHGLYQIKRKQSFGENYYKLLFDIFYEHPMESIDQIKKLNKLDLDFLSRSKKQIEMTLFVKHIIPAVRKSAKQLARMTKK